MSPGPRDDAGRLPPDVVACIDQACDLFEASWKAADQPPDIADYLAGLSGPGRIALLQELILVDVHYRRQAGPCPRATDYASRFPELDRFWLEAALESADKAAQASTSPVETPLVSAGSSTSSSSPRRFYCPRCHNPIQLADQGSDEVLCPSCAGSFRVEETTPTAASAAMRPVGKFRLFERVGVGAFGAVWRARDEELYRQVALKIPHTGLLSTAAELERFYREARAAAQLRHPGIVTVHEVASVDGLPIIVSEFVQGATLRDWLQDHRPTFRESTEIVARLAEAMHYAHSLGVIHRDVKPANVMIEIGGPGESGVRPLLMDFGLARRGDAEATMTAEGQVLGTPAYMSPELAQGDAHRVDGRSDVYSLGVVLYELLTGELPFRGSKAIILNQVLNEEPTRPRRVDRRIPRDLETICLKCLEKAPARRYPTAKALEEDLRRFQAGEPVHARPVRTPERIWKWSRRRPAVAGLLFGLIVAIVAGFVGMTALWLQAKEQQQQTQVALEAEARQRQRAQVALEAEAHHRQRARQALDTLSSEMVEQWLTKQQARDLTPAQRDFLQQALGYYEEFAQETGEDEQTRKSLAAACWRVAFIRGKLGQLAEAEAAYDRSIGIYSGLAADFPPDPFYRKQLALMSVNKADLLDGTGRVEQAERAYRNALDMQRQLVAAFPDRPEYRQGTADIADRLGRLLRYHSGRLKDAEAFFRDVLAIRRKLATDFPKEANYRHNLAQCLNNLGELLAVSARPKDAEAAYRESLDVENKLISTYPNGPAEYRELLGLTYNKLGVLLVDTGRMKEAETQYQEALARQKPMTVDFPTVPQYRRNLALTYHNLGELFRRTSQPQKAEAAFSDSLAIQKQLVADYPSMLDYRKFLASTQSMLGTVLAATGRRGPAEAAYQSALALQKQLVAECPDAPEYALDQATTEANLATVLMQSGKGPQAEAALREAIGTLKRLKGDFARSPRCRSQVASSQYNLGLLLASLGRMKDAEDLYRQALLDYQGLVDELPTVTEYRYGLAFAHRGVCDTLARTGRLKEAEAAYREALEIEKRLVADFPTVAEHRRLLALTQFNFGSVLAAAGKPRETEAAYRESVAIYKPLAAEFASVPEYRVELASTQSGLGQALATAGKTPEAETAYRDALATQKQLAKDFPGLPEYRLRLASTYNSLGQLLAAKGKSSEAHDAFQSALGITREVEAHPATSSSQLVGRRLLIAQAEGLLGLGDHAGAAVAAERLLKAAVGVNDRYNAACLLSRSAVSVEKDKKLPDARRKELAGQYADRAVAALAQAIRGGYRDLDHMKKDSDLDAIRSRKDYQKLLADVEAQFRLLVK